MFWSGFARTDNICFIIVFFTNTYYIISFSICKHYLRIFCEKAQNFLHLLRYCAHLGMRIVRIIASSVSACSLSAGMPLLRTRSR